MANETTETPHPLLQSSRPQTPTTQQPFHTWSTYRRNTYFLRNEDEILNQSHFIHQPSPYVPLQYLPWVPVLCLSRHATSLFASRSQLKNNSFISLPSSFAYLIYSKSTRPKGHIRDKIKQPAFPSYFTRVCFIYLHCATYRSFESIRNIPNYLGCSI